MNSINIQKKVWKVFKLNNVNDYHDLYVQNNTLLLADIFEIFRYKCIENTKLILLVFRQN